MAKPMLDALKVLMATGAYKPILSKWYVLSGSDHESADQRSDLLVGTSCHRRIRRWQWTWAMRSTRSSDAK